ncbi:MAG: hypothetical protein ABI265_01615 [Gallionella sp.]
MIGFDASFILVFQFNLTNCAIVLSTNSCLKNQLQKVCFWPIRLILQYHSSAVGMALCKETCICTSHLHASCDTRRFPVFRCKGIGSALCGAGVTILDGFDAGQVIGQDTNNIDHGDTVEDPLRYGRDIEKAVLSGELRYHVKSRVQAFGNKTIVVR